MRVLITGASGFLGSHVAEELVRDGVTVRCLVRRTSKVDFLRTLNGVELVLGSVEQRDSLDEAAQGVDAVVHAAGLVKAKSPDEFFDINVRGTFNMLEAARDYWGRRGKPADFRFHHVSTDEVFGSLGSTGRFTETTPYDPRSPYSASKAASDHLVRAWHETYGLPVLLTNCSNNYGPYHFPEKLVPVVILNAIAGRPM